MNEVPLYKSNDPDVQKAAEAFQDGRRLLRIVQDGELVYMDLRDVNWLLESNQQVKARLRFQLFWTQVQLAALYVDLRYGWRHP